MAYNKPVLTLVDVAKNLIQGIGDTMQPDHNPVTHLLTPGSTTDGDDGFAAV
jgi:hypothetical protein